MMKIVEAFLSQGKAEGWEDKTVLNYRQRLTPFVAFVRKKGRKRLADIDPVDVDEFMQLQADKGLMKETRRGIASTIRLFFRRLAVEGKILSNPARDIALPDGGEPDLPEPPLEEHEVAELFDSLPRKNVIDLRNRCHLELLYGCGLRMMETIGLDLRDVDLTNRIIHVRGKGSRSRDLPLLRGVLGALKDYLALRSSLLRGPDHGALILSRRGRRLTPETFREWLRNLNKARGPNARSVHPHLLRHSIAVHLLRGGADIRHIQEFLGHAKLETTKIYLRLVPGRVKEEYEKAMPEIDVGVGKTGLMIAHPAFGW